MSPSGRFNHRLLYWTVWDRFMQVLYLGRAPRKKETLPDFREKCRVARHSRVFRGLTGSQRTPEMGVSQNKWSFKLIWFLIQMSEVFLQLQFQCNNILLPEIER